MQANSIVEREELQKSMWSPYPEHSLTLWALPPLTHLEPPSHLDTRSQLQSKQRRMQRWQISRDFKHTSSPTSMTASSGRGKTTEILATHRLNFGNQSITKLNIPVSSISYLTNLVEIRMPQNKLRNLPESLFMLTQLEILNLENNCLDESCALERWWLRLVHLRVLFLADNLFGSLPGSLGRMAKLFYLDVSDNRRLRYLPAEILSSTSIGTLTAYRCSTELLDQLASTRDQFVVPRNLPVPALKDICIRNIYTAIYPYLFILNHDQMQDDRKHIVEIQDDTQDRLLMFEACEEIRRNPNDYFVADLLNRALDEADMKLPMCTVCDSPVFYTSFSLLRTVGTWCLPFCWLCCSEKCRDQAEAAPISSQLINKQF